MPKLIDYPRTSYAGAWELAEIVDDTGGKCEIETAARKLNRKVSGSFKAIIGSAVKFGLLTSKRELLSTTTLFKRIKHAYDKKEELLFHREAFLTPPLFSQICRKFRLRELPVQMLDVMLIREFSVEEINAQGVAKAFVEGCRMVNLLDDHNIMADIDDATNRQQPRRELASPTLNQGSFNTAQPSQAELPTRAIQHSQETRPAPAPVDLEGSPTPTTNPIPGRKSQTDAVASLFGLFTSNDEPQSKMDEEEAPSQPPLTTEQPNQAANTEQASSLRFDTSPQPIIAAIPQTSTYQLQISGPGLNTTLSILEEDDLVIAQALLEKIRRQLKARES